MNYFVENSSFFSFPYFRFENKNMGGFRGSGGPPMGGFNDKKEPPKDNRDFGQNRDV